MNLFRKKKVVISERDPSYKVRYLGNVQTSMTKGEGCVDKPVSLLWNNYLTRPIPAMEMDFSIGASGLKVYTKEQGVTDYSAHRILYCVAHPEYPKLFAWVYRHEGKKMKVELRCHAVLCTSKNKAGQIETQLKAKLKEALKEFMREKTRRQNSRLTRSQSLGSAGQPQMPLRKKLLSPGQNFKPPIERSLSAPKLIAICEDGESEHAELYVNHSVPMGVVVEEDEEEEEEEEDLMDRSMECSESSAEADDLSAINFITAMEDLEELSFEDSDVVEVINNHKYLNGDDLSDHITDLDIEDPDDPICADRRRKDSQLAPSDSDGASSESGFSEQNDSQKHESGGHQSMANGHIRTDALQSISENVQSDSPPSNISERL